MDSADAAKRDHLWLLVTPAGERSRPLAGAAHGVNPLAALDHAAINQARDHGRELARDDTNHGLVEQPEPLG